MSDSSDRPFPLSNPGMTRRTVTRWSGVAASAMALNAVVPAAALADDTVALDPGRSEFTVSEYLTGLHFVYCYEDDAIYADGEFADWARRAGIGAARFPGGTVVKYWDWEHPSGVMEGDPWDPAYRPAIDAPARSWMSLDEFLAFAKRSGVLPILGVNMLSGHRFGREADSIARAARMVAYVRQHGFGGADWYLGNEEIGLYGGVEAFAQVFARHSHAMKVVDPTIRTFWNDNDGDPERILAFLAHDDGQADGYETHGKYPYGGEYKGLGTVTLDEWRRDVPIRDRKNYDRTKGGRVWRDAARVYRRAAASAGRPKLLIANNEYGLGGSHIEGFDRYTYGLVLCEFLMEMLIGNWDRTAYWSNVLNSEFDPDVPANRPDDRGLIAVNHHERLNPLHFGLEAIAKAQGGTFVGTFEPALGVHGCAVRNGDTLRIYALNKSAERARIGFRVPTASRAWAATLRRRDDDFGVVGNVDLAIHDGRFTLESRSDTFSSITVSLAKT